MTRTAEDVLGLTALSDVTNLVPRDLYSTQVLLALYAVRMFAGIISVVREDMTAGPGSTVKVPTISPRVAQGPISEGSALTATATTTSVYAITLAKYGDYDLVNKEVFHDQTIFSQADFITNIGNGLGEKVDQVVYDALKNGTPASGNTATLAVAGTLTDLYAKIVTVRAGMKKNKVRPDFLLLGPDQEAQFLQDTNQGVRLAQTIVGPDGVLQILAGLKVIVSPLANSNTSAASRVQAILIDSKRAVGEAWGRRPDTIVDELSLSQNDQVKLVTWLRYGCAVLDPKAFGQVTNP